MDPITRFLMELEKENSDKISDFMSETKMVKDIKKQALTEDERYEKALFDFRMGFIL